MGSAAARLTPSRLMFLNVCSSSILYAAGDVLQQRIESRRGRNSWPRTGRMASVGVPIGAMNHCWYLILDRILPGVGGRMVVKKVLADQLIYGPFCLSTFFIGMGILERKNMTEITTDMKRLFLPTYLVECVVWPGAQTINFLFVPPKLRVLYVNVVLLMWVVFLSYIKHKDTPKHQN